MKKLLLILITAVVGLVAHADKIIYYDNSGTKFTSIWYWTVGADDGQKKDMDQVSGSIYKVSVPDNKELLFYQGDWDGGNGGKTLNLTSSSNPSLQNLHMYKGGDITNDGRTLVDMTPATVYFSYDCSGSWSYNQAVSAKTEGSALVWTKRITPSDSDVYMVINTKSVDVSNKDTRWNNLTTGKDCVYYIHNVPGTDNDGNAKINANQAYVGQLQANGIGSCIHFTGCKTNASYDLKLTFDNGAFSIKAEEVTGGVDPDPEPDVDGYYVYFVNKNNWGSVSIWAWNSNHNHLTTAPSWPGDQMELVSGNTYRWRLPEGNEVPSEVKFSNNGATATGNLRFVNHATYYPDGKYVEEFVAQNNVVYCHFKLDRMRRGNVEKPSCEVFSSTNGNVKRSGQMERVYDPQTGEDLTARYEIWQYTIPDDVLGQVDNVKFYTNNDNYWKSNESNGGKRSEYLKKNWTKYIYATASSGTNYACPTFVTFADFLKLHRANVEAMGRAEIFIVGPNATGWDTDKFVWYDEIGNQHNFNGYDLLNCDRLIPDDGVFYLKVVPGGCSEDKDVDGDAGTKGNKFKISWINVAEHRSAAEENEGSLKDSDATDNLDNARRWATFDLGAIGVDETMVKKYYSEAYDESCGPSGRVKFVPESYNKAFKYCYYNTCDWNIWEWHGTNPRWIIIDTHYDPSNSDYQCESVTITDFDPHPSMHASIYHFDTNAARPAKAPAHPELYAKANGEKELMSNAGHAEAQITVSASEDGKNKFDRFYEMEINGENVGNIDGEVTDIKYNYFPLDVTNAGMKVRARYEDKTTKLKFHSRTGDAEVTGLTYTFNAPTGTAVNAKYIEEEYHVTYKTDGEGNQLFDKHNKPIVEKVERTFGVLVPNFNINITSEYHFGSGTDAKTGELRAYADYRVFDENGKEITEKCKLFTAAKNQHMIDCINLTYKSESAYSNYCWNWSEDTHWAQALKEETDRASLYFEAINETPVADVEDLKERTYTIVLQAVYPLIYQKSFNAEAIATSANGELIPVAKTAATSDGSEYVTKHVRKTLPITVTVSPDNTVTGVDEVFGDAEADNADAPAEYYTISGVRVNGDLAPGIYVVRRGNKVTKEVVK